MHGLQSPRRLSKLFRSNNRKGTEDLDALVADPNVAYLDHHDDHDYDIINTTSSIENHKEGCGNSSGDMGPNMTTTREKKSSSGGGDASPNGSHSGPPHAAPAAAPRIQSCSGSNHAMMSRMRRRHSITNNKNNTRIGACSGPINISNHNPNDHVPKKIIQVAGEINFVVVDEGCVFEKATTTTSAPKVTVPKSPTSAMTTDVGVGSPFRGVRRRLSLNLSTPHGKCSNHDNLHKNSDLNNSSSSIINLNSPTSSSRAKLFTTGYEPSSPTSPSASGSNTGNGSSHSAEVGKSKPTSSRSDSKAKETIENEVQKRAEANAESMDESKSRRMASTDSKHESKSSKTSTEDSESKPTRSFTDSDKKNDVKKTECSGNDHERAIEKRQREIEKLERAIKEHKREQKRLMDEKQRNDTLDRLKRSASKVKEKRKTSTTTDSKHNRSKKTSPTSSPESKKTRVDPRGDSSPSNSSIGKKIFVASDISKAKDDSKAEKTVTDSKVDSESSNKTSSPTTGKANPKKLLKAHNTDCIPPGSKYSGIDVSEETTNNDDDDEIAFYTLSHDAVDDNGGGHHDNNETTHDEKSKDNKDGDHAAVGDDTNVLKSTSFATHWVLSPTTTTSVAGVAATGHHLELDIQELQETQQQQRGSMTMSPQKKSGGGGMAKNIRKRFAALPRRTSIG